MANLKALIESLGYTQVTTYIQSGNVICNAAGGKAGIRSKIEEAIATEYGFEVPVLLMHSGDMGRIIENCPFGRIDPVAEGTTVLVTFLFAKPHKTAVSELQSYVAASEEVVVKGTTAYLRCPNGYGRSKLSNTFLEKKLAVKASTRNWKSVCKLHELSLL